MSWENFLDCAQPSCLQSMWESPLWEQRECPSLTREAHHGGLAFCLLSSGRNPEATMKHVGQGQPCCQEGSWNLWVTSCPLGWMVEKNWVVRGFLTVVKQNTLADGGSDLWVVFPHFPWKICIDLSWDQFINFFFSVGVLWSEWKCPLQAQVFEHLALGRWCCSGSDSPFLREGHYWELALRVHSLPPFQLPYSASCLGLKMQSPRVLVPCFPYRTASASETKPQQK